MPRVVAGLLAGMALAVAGAIMQALTRNPLADSGILGINAGAAFAVVVSLIWLRIASLTMYALAGMIGSGSGGRARLCPGLGGQGRPQPLAAHAGGRHRNRLPLRFDHADF